MSEELSAGADEVDPKCLLVRLRIFDGLPHEQIASRLNLSVDTVKKRFERVRKRLRQALDDES